MSAGDRADVVRAIEADGVVAVRALEVTMTVPRAVELIEELARTLPPDVLVGAGTVLDPETARQVILAGARFVVSPILRIPNHRDVPPLRRRGRAGLLLPDRDPAGLGVGGGHGEGVSGDGTRAGVCVVRRESELGGGGSKRTFKRIQPRWAMTEVDRLAAGDTSSIQC